MNLSDIAPGVGMPGGDDVDFKFSPTMGFGTTFSPTFSSVLMDLGDTGSQTTTPSAAAAAAAAAGAAEPGDDNLHVTYDI